VQAGDKLIFKPAYGLKRVETVLKTTDTRVYLGEKFWVKRNGHQPGDYRYAGGYASIPSPGEIEEVQRFWLAEKMSVVALSEWSSLSVSALQEIDAIRKDPKSKVAK